VNGDPGVADDALADFVRLTVAAGCADAGSLNVTIEPEIRTSATAVTPSHRSSVMATSSTALRQSIRISIITVLRSADDLNTVSTILVPPRQC
jgi:hypothetical protein